MSNERQLIIIYNADASLRGKVSYAFRKLSTSTSDGPACAACDITHGGLSLNEIPGWTKVKGEIEAQGLTVVQWHRDEVEGGVKEWVQSNGVRYPAALSRDQGGSPEDMKLVADSGELAGCVGDANLFMKLLKEKGVMQETGPAST